MNDQTFGRAAPIVRRGHYLTLDYMASEEFAEVKALLEAEPEIGGVYFRPVDSGVTMVDLHPDSPRPRIGIGEDPIIKVGTTADELAPSIPARIAYLKEVRASQARPSEENQLEARLIREAQSGQLRIPGFPEQLRLVHSQWRLQLDGGHKFTDLIAVDIDERELVIIELKRQPDPSALDQVAEYVSYFEANAAELLPFFMRLAIIMGARYDCQPLAKLSELSVASSGIAAWPGASGELEVKGLD